MKRIVLLLMLLVPVMAGTIYAQVTFDGFVQGLYGGSLDADNPTATEYTANETRLQLRTEHYGDDAEVFGRIDFVWDGADSSKYEIELREAYIKFRLGSNFDFKVGRQILTWGTGDLIFINDVFAKDYRSFFVGRDDQYLKAPQTAIRMSWFNPLGELAVAYTPRFEANRLPNGNILSYYNPIAGQIVGTGMNTNFYFDPPTPEASFENGEIAMRLSRQVGYFNLAGYFYHGFYKNPLGMVATPGFMPMPVFPRLNLYGFSLRGQMAGGVVWFEGGYYDSRDYNVNDDPMLSLMPNSSLTGLIGYERQVATNLTMNLQWQLDQIEDYEAYETTRIMMGAYVRDEVRHLLTSRITKLLSEETIILSGFVFYSPTDEDIYLRTSVEYKQSDELTLTVGANIFDGKNQSTDFGQFDKNDNAYLKVTYGF